MADAVVSPSTPWLTPTLFSTLFSTSNFPTPKTAVITTRSTPPIITYPSFTTTHSTFTTTDYHFWRTVTPEYEDGWRGVELGVPVTITIAVFLVVLFSVIAAKKRRGRLRQEGRQHPSRVMSGGPAMSVDAYRRYPGTVPHSQLSQGQSRSNEVTSVADPAPMYPGPPIGPLHGELPPTYEEAMRIDAGLQNVRGGSTNLGYSSTSLQIDQPGGSNSQEQNSPVPSSGEPVHNLPAETVVNIPNSDNDRNEDASHSTDNSANELGHSSRDTVDSQNSSMEEKSQPEICADETVPKPD